MSLNSMKPNQDIYRFFDNQRTKAQAENEKQKLSKICAAINVLKVKLTIDNLHYVIPPQANIPPYGYLYSQLFLFLLGIDQYVQQNFVADSFQYASFVVERSAASDLKLWVEWNKKLNIPQNTEYVNAMTTYGFEGKFTYWNWYSQKNGHLQSNAMDLITNQNENGNLYSTICHESKHKKFIQSIYTPKNHYAYPSIDESNTSLFVPSLDSKPPSADSTQTTISTTSSPPLKPGNGFAPSKDSYKSFKYHPINTGFNYSSSYSGQSCFVDSST